MLARLSHYRNISDLTKEKRKSASKAPGVTYDGEHNNINGFEKDVYGVSCLHFFFIISIIFFCCCNLAVSFKSVDNLPGYSGNLPFKLETGYIDVGEYDEDVQPFYKNLVESAKNIMLQKTLWCFG
nr:serine carboxypeptidase-like 7 isoform X1 [Ipomoea trifida]